MTGITSQKPIIGNCTLPLLSFTHRSIVSHSRMRAVPCIASIAKAGYIKLYSAVSRCIGSVSVNLQVEPLEDLVGLLTEPWR